jgi:drug/metabolite transporter (DMT)-like permease
MTRRTAVFTVIVSAACFATLGVLTKWAFAHGAEPISLLAVRFAISALAMGVVQAVRDPKGLKVSGAEIGRFLLLALTGYGAASLCYSFAVRSIGASVTTVLLYTYPALVSIIGWLFLKERFPPRRLAAVLLTFAGCALVAGVFSSGSRLDPAGLLLGLGAGLGYALFNVLSYRSLQRSSRFTVMTYTFGFSSIGLGLIAGFAGTLPTVAKWDSTAWLAMALIVAVPTLAAVALYLGGVRRMGAAQAAVVSTLELPFTVGFAALIFADERLGLLQLVGAAVVLAGVVLAESGSPAGDVEGVAAV